VDLSNRTLVANATILAGQNLSPIGYRLAASNASLEVRGARETINGLSEGIQHQQVSQVQLLGVFSTQIIYKPRCRLKLGLLKDRLPASVLFTADFVFQCSARPSAMRRIRNPRRSSAGLPV